MGYHLRVKICGVTTPADALHAVRAGADAVGFNFYPPSPRYVTDTQAAAILRALPPFTHAVGVFVERRLAEVLARVEPLGRLRAIQWHGQDHEVFDAHPLDLIQAFAVRDADSLRDVTRHLAECRQVGQLPAAVLLDAHAAGLHGGTGKTAPWDPIAAFDPGVPVLLAGGLTPENVAEAVWRVRPWGVDVASGVESSPGVKDPEKVLQFIARARAAAASVA